VRRIGFAVAAAVAAAALTSCAQHPDKVLEEKYQMSQVHVADRDEVNGLVDSATTVLLRGGYQATFQIGSDGNDIEVTRYDNRVEFELGGLRLGIAGQVVIGDKAHPTTVRAYDNGKRSICTSGTCVKFTDTSTSNVPNNLADVADAANVVAHLLPVSPQWVTRTNSATDQAFEQDKRVFVGTRQTLAGPAKCVAIAGAEGDIAPDLCVLDAFVGTGTPVDRGAKDDGSLSYTLTQLTTA
jgi:opacity protein-like surface antigen